MKIKRYAAWLHVSENAITSIDQQRGRLWEQITNAFDGHRRLRCGQNCKYAIELVIYDSQPRQEVVLICSIVEKNPISGYNSEDSVHKLDYILISLYNCSPSKDKFSNV